MGQENGVTIVPINTFHSHPVPTDSLIIHKFAWDTTSWTLFVKDGQILALNIDHPNAREYVPADTLPLQVIEQLWNDEKIDYKKGNGILPVDDGYLIGIDQGEWGGRILWYSKDGKEKYKISDDQISDFIRKDGHIYAIEGLLHTYTSKGSFIELRKINSKWVSQLVTKLPFAPFGIAINSKNNFVIGTSNNIIEMRKDGHYTILCDKPVWNAFDDNYLDPKSLLIKNDILYAGMKKGVLRYDLRTKEERWLMRD